jgi:hypothetical protein
MTSAIVVVKEFILCSIQFVKFWLIHPEEGQVKALNVSLSYRVLNVYFSAFHVLISNLTIVNT